MLGIERARDVMGIKKFLKMLEVYEIIPNINETTKAIKKLSIHLDMVENIFRINLSSKIISFMLKQTCSNVGK